MLEFRSAMVCWGNISVSTFCLLFKDDHRKKLQASNCAEECQLNPAKPQVKDNFYNFLKPTVKARSITNFILTQHKGKHYLKLTLIRQNLLEKAFLILSNQYWLRSWNNRWQGPFNLTVVTETLSWALLVDALCRNLLVWKPTQHVKVSFISPPQGRFQKGNS